MKFYLLYFKKTQNIWQSVFCTLSMFFSMFFVFSMTPLLANGKTPSNLIYVELSGINDKNDKDLKQNAKNNLQLETFNGRPSPESDRLNWLYNEGFNEIKSALEPYGYYQSNVTGELKLVNTNWLIKYFINKGEPTKIKNLTLKIIGEGETDQSLQRIIKRSKIKQNTILNHANYEDTKDKLQEVAQSRGYFESKYIENTIEVDIDQYIANINLEMDTGPRYLLGKVNFHGGELDPIFLQKFVFFAKNSPYLDETLLTLQGSLIASNYFQDVVINTNPDTKNKEVPIDIDLTMRKKKNYTAGIGFSTDIGPRIRGNIEWRYINKWGHKFKTDLLIAQKKQTAELLYTIPGKNPLSDHYEIFLNTTLENTNTQNYKTASFGIASNNQRDNITYKKSIEYRYDKFKSDDPTITKKVSTYILLPTISLLWKNQKDIRFMQAGMSLYGMIRGASDKFLSDINFIQGRIKGKLYIPLKQNHRLIARAEVGMTAFSKKNGIQDLPTNLRFFAGGDSSVRGYQLDAIGPLDSAESNNNKKKRVLGAKKLLVASLEYEYRFKKEYAIATFVDVGDAFNGKKWDPKIGIGLGGRWYSPIGAIKVDLAHALNKKMGDRFRLHLMIGSEL